jgi:hypothetical protein
MMQIATIRVQRPDDTMESWAKLIRFCQENPFCTMTLTIKEGEPKMAEVIRESIKFS